MIASVALVIAVCMPRCVSGWHLNFRTRTEQMSQFHFPRQLEEIRDGGIFHTTASKISVHKFIFRNIGKRIEEELKSSYAAPVDKIPVAV